MLEVLSDYKQPVHQLTYQINFNLDVTVIKSLCPLSVCVCVCFRRKLCLRGSSCVSSVRGVILVSPTLTTMCDSRWDGQETDVLSTMALLNLSCSLSNSLICPYQAFLGICDVLTAHSYQLHVWDPTSFGPLLYTPSPKLQRALLNFVCMHIFVGPDCDSQCSGETSACVHEAFFHLFIIHVNILSLLLPHLEVWASLHQ